MSGSGFGQNVGQNVGGGGIPYLVNLLPVPDDFMPDDLHVHLTVGVQGSLIDLAQTRVLVNLTLAFDGSTGTFTAGFPGSSYVYDPANNGYTFDILTPSDQLTSIVHIEVDTRTTDGVSTSQTYGIFSSPPYPPAPFGIPMGDVPLSRFSGEVTGGILGRPGGLAFISPALNDAESNSEIDVDYVQSRVLTAEPYQPPQTANPRPFLVGPPPAVPPVSPPVWPPQFSASYVPVLNDPHYALMNTRPLVRGVMTDTMSLVATVILL